MESLKQLHAVVKGSVALDRQWRANCNYLFIFNTLQQQTSSETTWMMRQKEPPSTRMTAPVVKLPASLAR